MSASSIRFISSTGIPASDWSQWNAYLGVSFSKTKYFSRSTMKSYADWVGRHFKSLLIIVGDHLEVYNSMVFRGLTKEQAESQTLRVGLELRRAYDRAVIGVARDRVRIELASDILKEPSCQNVLSLVHRIAKTNNEFRDSLRNTVVNNLQGKLELLKATPYIKDRMLTVLINYLIEEIALIISIASLRDPRYEVSVFPNTPPQILIDIYAGAYGPELLSFTGKEPYRAIELGSIETSAPHGRNGWSF
jgi:tRNA-dependent cyclodipeptide synthase